MNVISFADFKAKKELDKHIEDLNLRICTYNFLKKLKVTRISQLLQIDWSTMVRLEKKALQIIEDLSVYLPSSLSLIDIRN